MYRFGDILIVKYCDLDFQQKQGIFVIIYDETGDDTDSCVLNMIGLKVTTKSHEQYGYYVELEQGLSNLKEQCRVCCSKPYVLHKANIVGFIGHLPNNKLNDIILTHKSFTDEVLRQQLASVSGL